MAKITGIKYTRDELIGIMETINNGAIWWGVVLSVDYTEDDRPKRIVVGPTRQYDDDEGGPEWGVFAPGYDQRELAITLNGVQDAIDRILRGDVKINETVAGRITTDIADIDGETADAIAQIACFKEIEFG